MLYPAELRGQRVQYGRGPRSGKDRRCRRAWLSAGFAALSLSIAALPALACIPETPGTATDVPTEGRVARIVDGDTLTLDDGNEVRLVGIQAPKLPLGRPGFKTWPLAEETRAALEKDTLGRQVKLYPGPTARDRYGRVLAQVHLGKVWIQGSLLTRGLARAYTFRDNRTCATELYARERAARAARRGIWALPYYAIRAAANVPAADIGSFQLVEGVVQAVVTRRARTYLDFGKDWHTDFTVTIAATDLKLFTAAGVAPESLAHKRIRVRGYLDRLNGPMMTINHPEAIEQLE